MSLPSRYHQWNAMPNRSPSSRPRSLSLADYQPLSFDRQALESAYQTSLATSSGTSWQSSSANTSVDTHETAPSTLSSHLKPGDNPHLRSPSLRGETTLPGGMAGIGAGHTLTPPQSPFHKIGPSAPDPNAISSGAPLTPPAEAPSLPVRPSEQKSRRYSGLATGRRQSHNQGSLDMADFEAVGYETDPGPIVSGPRHLPQPPTNVPAPELPQWEPDYKPQIPASLTQGSIQNAYAQLSAPPPNLPPRRNQPMSSQAGPSGSSWNGPASSYAGPSGSVGHQHQAGVSSALPVGAPDFPPAHSGGAEQPGHSHRPSHRPRPEAEKEVSLRASDRTPIWSTHLIDPSLRSSAVNIPHSVTNITNVALSGLAGGQRDRYNSTIGAPVEGLARAAQDWVVPPHGKFQSENGGIELGIGVIDSHDGGWGRDKGRKRARIEVSSKHGGIKVDVLEIDSNRQLDLKVDTRSGDVLVLIPDSYYGPIHVNAPAQPPVFLSIIQPQLAPISNPYNALFTTFVVPLKFRNDPRKSRSIEHRTSQQFERNTPRSFREESEMMNQIQAGYTGHVREEQDKIVINSQKGRVVIGYRDSLDEQEAARMDLKVGAQNGGRKKKWWRG